MIAEKRGDKKEERRKKKEERRKKKEERRKKKEERRKKKEERKEERRKKKEERRKKRMGTRILLGEEVWAKSSSSERMLLPPRRGCSVGVEYSDQRCFAAAPFDADQPPTLKVG